MVSLVITDWYRWENGRAYVNWLHFYLGRFYCGRELPFILQILTLSTRSVYESYPARFESIRWTRLHIINCNAYQYMSKSRRIISIWHSVPCSAYLRLANKFGAEYRGMCFFKFLCLRKYVCAGS